MLFWGPSEAHLVLPPFPVETTAAYDGWNTRPLVHLLQRPRTIGVLLLRLGRYGIGVFEDETLVLSKAGSRFVKGRHRKGGTSSVRFAHRREEQSNALYHRVCQAPSGEAGGARWPVGPLRHGRPQADPERLRKALRLSKAVRGNHAAPHSERRQAVPEGRPVPAPPSLRKQSLDFSPTGQEAGHGSSISISTTVTPPPPS